MSEAVRGVVEAYWRAANGRDWASFAGLLSPGIVYEVPQTRERVRGRDDYVEFNRSWPGTWLARLRRVVADDTAAVSWIDFEAEGQSMTGISFFTIEGGAITAITDWWPEPYEPPARMTDRIERY